MMIHGDDGHSCYDENGELTCIIAKMLTSDGPTWRELLSLSSGSNTYFRAT